MANLYLSTASPKGGPHWDYPAVRIREAYASDLHKRHTLVEDPEKADVILFATNYDYPPVGLGLLRENLYKQHKDKVVLFNSNDYPSPLLGGLCASWHSGLEAVPGTGQGWCYYHPTSAEPQIEYMPWPEGGPKYLWSFKGSICTHPVREDLFQIEDSEALLADTSKVSLDNLRGKTTEAEKQAFLEEYLDLLRQSAFIVCPRGRGASSMRLFEAMRAGRSPVIISDAWLPTPFIDWDSFSIRIAESDVASIPEILRERRADAEALGKIARAEWERVLGPQNLFHYITEAALMVQKANQRATTKQRVQKSMQITQPPYFRAILRHYAQKLRG